MFVLNFILGYVRLFPDEDVYLMYGDAKEIYREHTLIVLYNPSADSFLSGF